MTDQWIRDLLGWGLTYLAHSSILGALVLIGVRAFPASLPTRELAWKLALLGGVASVALQLALGAQPLLGRIELATTAQSADARASRENRENAVVGSDRHAAAWTAAPSQTILPTAAASPPAMAVTAPLETSRLERLTASGAARATVALWALASLVFLARLSRSEWRLRRRLASRRPATDARLRAQLDELSRSARLPRQIRLSVSSELDVPLVRGLVSPEICLPERALEELCERQQLAVLAHEVAHVERRDLHWQLLARVLETLVPFQPLHRIARHRLSEIAELRCDDWAVRAAGDPLPLARSLATVAGWRLQPAVPRVAPLDTESSCTAVALAARRGDLSRRVRRLLEPGLGTAPRRPWRRSSALLAGSAALVLTTWTAPTLTFGAPPPPPRAPEATPAPTPPVVSVEPVFPGHPPLAVVAPQTPPRETHPASPAPLAPTAWRIAPTQEVSPRPPAPPASARWDVPPTPAIAQWAVEPTAPTTPPTPSASAPVVAPWPNPGTPAAAPRAAAPATAPPTAIAPRASAAPTPRPSPAPFPSSPYREEQLALERLESEAAWLRAEALQLAAEAAPQSDNHEAPSDAAARQELIRELEAAVESLRSSTADPAGDARALAELARDLDRASARVRAQSVTHDAAAARRALAERQQRLQAEVDRQRARHQAQLEARQIERERQAAARKPRSDREQALERRAAERQLGSAATREQALQRQIEALELQQRELLRMIEELRRSSSRGRLPE
jgi:Zn-dependent protease with chaperone function